MTKAFNAELQRRLEAYITEVGSQEKAASLIGYSAATLSTYRKGVYNGDVDKLETRLREMFAVEEAAEELHAVSPDYVPTTISQKVYETIRICHLKGGLAIECGDAGIGKTKAAEKYVADYPNSAIMVTVNPCFTSLSSFLKLLCRQLRISAGRKDDMWLDIDSYLRGGRKVLIIDEAQHLPIKTVDAIRSFFDSNPQLGIVFVGNEETVTCQSGRMRVSFSQIKSRRKLTEVRRTVQITRDDVKLLFPALADCQKEIDFLHVIVQSEQGIRGAMNLYSLAADNENTTFDGLLATAREMRIVNL